MTPGNGWVAEKYQAQIPMRSSAELETSALHPPPVKKEEEKKKSEEMTTKEALRSA